MIEFLVIVVCLGLNALLACWEMAFVTVSRSSLRERVRHGSRDAKRVLDLREKPERTLSVLQVWITLVGVVAAAVGGVGASEWLTPILTQDLGLSPAAAKLLSILIVVIPYTLLSVVIGELVPKSLALRNPLAIILHGSRWMVWMDKAFLPIVSFLEWSTKMLLGMVPGGKSRAQESHADTIELEGLTREHRQYVVNLVNLRRKAIRDVMLPWEQVVTIDLSLSAADAASIIYHSGHSRIPVVAGEEVVGILNTKEFLTLRETGVEHWQGIVRPLVVVQQSDALVRALRLMQEKRSHLSIVLAGDKRVGIVTMEDIFEEIIGDIYDEDDDGKLRRIFVARRRGRLGEMLQRGAGSSRITPSSNVPPSAPI